MSGRRHTTASDVERVCVGHRLLVDQCDVPSQWWESAGNLQANDERARRTARVLTVLQAAESLGLRAFLSGDDRAELRTAATVDTLVAHTYLSRARSH